MLGPDTLPANEDTSRLLSIRKVGEPMRRHDVVPRDRVVPERIRKVDGPVYQEFCSVFTPPRIGQILFGLIANQLDSTPTLKYEAEATARLREDARNKVPDHYDPYARGEVLVDQGQTIGEEQLILLRLEHEAALSELGFGDRAKRVARDLRPGRGPLFPGGLVHLPARAAVRS